MKREKGTVTKWDAGRGFGFAKPDSGAPSVFLFWREFDGWVPNVGDRLSFVSHLGDRGWRASAIELVTVDDGR